MVDQTTHDAAIPVERPGSVHELAGIVRGAALARKSLAVQAGGTHTRFGNVGTGPDAVVDVTGLDGIVEYSAVDLTLAVEAGVRLSAIDQLLAEHDQRLAFDAPNRNAATIGGCFAVGLSGPRRLRYGSLKDMVIGVEVVNSRGEITKSGGMVVKNVSGYELARLHYGAHGAYGIVSRVNLKVLPAVASRVEAIIEFDQPGAATAFGARLLTSTLDPAAVYVVLTNQGRWALHAQFEGSDGFTQEQAGLVIDRRSSSEKSLNAEIVELDGSSTPAFDDVVDLTDDVAFAARLSVAASLQASVLDSVSTSSAMRVLGDLGSGLIYLQDRAGIESLAELFSASVPTTFLALPNDRKADLDVFGEMDINARRIVTALKDEFDPNRILNPGRFAAFL